MSNRMHTFATAAAVLAAALSVAACGTESKPSMTIQGFHGLEPNGEGCEMKDDLLAGNTYDAFSSAEGYGSYAMYVEIGNVMPNNEDLSAGRVNTARIQLREIEVQFDNSGAWSFLPSSRVIAAGAIIESNGELYYPVEVLDPTLGALMVEGAGAVASPVGAFGDRAQLKLTFVARGEQMDGTEIESNELDFVLDVCHGCLGGCPVGYDTIGCSLVQADGYKCEESETTE